MSAPLSSARLGGSAGVSIDVGFTGYAEKAGKMIVELNNKLKEIKAAPNIDYIETAILRGMKAAAQKFQREAVKVEVQARMNLVGLGGQPISAAQLGGMRNFDSMVGLASPRFGLSDGRQGRFSGMAGVEMTVEQRAKANIKAANIEYDERMRLEKKFQEQIEAEGEKRGKSKGGSASGGFGISNILRGGAYGFLINEIVSAALGSAGIAKGLGMALASGDTNNRRAGLASAIQSAESIPVLGTLVAGFDKLAGFTESLNKAMEVRVQNEQAMVTLAGFSGSQGAVARASANFRNIQFDRSIEKYKNPYLWPLALVGEMTGEKAELQQQGKLNAQINSQSIRLGDIQDREEARSYVTAEYVGQLQRELSPQKAARVALGGKWANAIALQQDQTKKDAMTRAMVSEKAALEFAQGRGNSIAQYARETDIGASQYSVRNMGLHLADESAFRLIRSVEGDIKFANNETIFDESGKPIDQREEMRKAGLARLRDFKASLQVRGGGVVGTFNPSLERIGDPLRIFPDTQAREIALTATDHAMRRIGLSSRGNLDFETSGSRARDLGLNNYAGTDISSKLFEVLAKLSDQLGRGGLLLPN